MSSFWAIGSPVFWKNSEKNARLCMEMKHWDGIMISSENQKRCMAANRTKNKQTITSLLFWNRRAFICIKIELDRVYCIIIIILMIVIYLLQNCPNPNVRLSVRGSHLLAAAAATPPPHRFVHALWKCLHDDWLLHALDYASDVSLGLMTYSSWLCT